MSLSKLNTQGQKGTNGPWQRTVVELLNAIRTGLVTVVGTFTASSTQRTPSITVVSAAGAGSVAAGARVINITTSEDFSGSILGVTVNPNWAYPFAVYQNDDTIGAIAFIITTGSLTITKTI